MISIKKQMIGCVLCSAFIVCSQNEESTEDCQQVINRINDSVSVQLNYKNEICIENQIKIKFEGPIKDSQCPQDVTCMWAGDGSVKIKFMKEIEINYHNLHTTLSPREIVYGGFKIKLDRLSPHAISTKLIKQEEYKIDLVI